MTTNSKSLQDNTALFLSCAKEWATCDGEDCNRSALQSNLLQSNALEENSVQNTALQETLLPENQIVENQTPFYNAQAHNAQKRLIPSQVSYFYSSLFSQLTLTKPCATTQIKEKAIDLINAPHQAINWHLCLMPHKINVQENNPDLNTEQTMHIVKKKEELPLENDILYWLKEGMAKGWLRHLAMEDFSSILPSAYLSQDRFWSRFSTSCECKGRMSLILFKLPEMTKKKGLQSKLHTAYVQELIEQILLTIKETDFFGEINGFGIALVMAGCGAFSATAHAERIMSRLESAFQDLPELAQLPLHVAIAEKEDGENADTLFAHAKELIHVREEETHTHTMYNQATCSQTTCNQTQHKQIQSNKVSQANIFTLHVYHNTQKTKEKNSLVQSDEKRFLFFGMH